MNVKIMELKHTILDKNAEIGRLKVELEGKNNALAAGIPILEEAADKIEALERQLAEARAEVEKLKRMTPTDAIAMRTSSVKQALREGWEQAKKEAVEAINNLPNEIYSVRYLVPYLSKLEYKEPTNDR